MLKSTTPENVIQLLVVEDSRNRAEQYVNAIRNAGIAVHAVRVDTQEQLDQSLETTTPDIVLCACDSTQVTLPQVVTKFRKHPDIPLLVLYHKKGSHDRKSLMAAMRYGARDIISRDDLEHLQLVIKREFETLHRSRDLKVPENIRLIQQPSHSPELNPVEHLCEELREKYLPNKAYKSLDAVEKALCKGLRDLHACMSSAEMGILRR